VNGFENGFEFALSQLRAGRGVRRSGWNGAGLTVRMQVPDEHSKMTLPYLYIEYPAEHPITPGARCPWLASQTDILAQDWGVVP
jgi:alkylated DNA repair dioxygenase AlkB